MDTDFGGGGKLPILQKQTKTTKTPAMNFNHGWTRMDTDEFAAKERKKRKEFFTTDERGCTQINSLQRRQVAQYKVEDRKPGKMRKKTNII